jgi:hypothetical protein
MTKGTAARRNQETDVQSGDTQGLSTTEDVNSESVEGLVSEGQGFEADAVAGVEGAGDEGVHELTTSEVLQDDVPSEYDDRDR